jgi:hypothetical protein
MIPLVRKDPIIFNLDNYCLANWVMADQYWTYNFQSGPAAFLQGKKSRTKIVRKAKDLKWPNNIIIHNNHIKTRLCPWEEQCCNNFSYVSNWLIREKAEEVTSQRREEAPICLPRAVRKSYGVSSVLLHQPVGFTPSQSRNNFLITKHNHGQSINKNSFAQDATTSLSLTESKQSLCACHYCCGLFF